MKKNSYVKTLKSKARDGSAIKPLGCCYADRVQFLAPVSGTSEGLSKGTMHECGTYTHVQPNTHACETSKKKIIIIKILKIPELVFYSVTFEVDMVAQIYNPCPQETGLE